MEQLLYVAIAWCLGVVLCAYVAHRIVIRYRLPWKSTLMYFGLLPYPDEVTGGRLREARAAPRGPRERVSPRPAPAGRRSPA